MPWAGDTEGVASFLPGPGSGYPEAVSPCRGILIAIRYKRCYNLRILTVGGAHMDLRFSEDGLILAQMQAAGCFHLPREGGGSKASLPSELVDALARALNGKKRPNSNRIEFEFEANGEEKAVTWGYAAAKSGFDGNALKDSPDVYMQIRDNKNGTYSVWIAGAKGVELLRQDMLEQGKRTPASLGGDVATGEYMVLDAGNVFKLAEKIREAANESD